MRRHCADEFLQANNFGQSSSSATSSGSNAGPWFGDGSSAGWTGGNWPGTGSTGATQQDQQHQDRLTGARPQQPGWDGSTGGSTGGGSWADQNWGKDYLDIVPAPAPCICGPTQL